ncbi:jg13252 [Pararge aegeria aegeria]|uniref:Jg13252 protein n=1 Tax=Pararge aegeria aegeria TaxID=348720 RepID=A0A8S4RGG9_9NEOP|nr:jg13252 [Pararge aegeria aegeria]
MSPMLMKRRVLSIPISRIVPMSDKYPDTEKQSCLSRNLELRKQGRPLCQSAVLRCWNGYTAPVNAALVGPKRGGQTMSGESLGAAGGKRPRTVECEPPFKRPMSSRVAFNWLN